MSMTKYDVIILRHYKIGSPETRKEFLSMDDMYFHEAVGKAIQEKLIIEHITDTTVYKLTFKGLWKLYLYEHNKI